MLELVFDRAQLLLLHVKSLTTFVEGFSVFRTEFPNLSEFGLAAPTNKMQTNLLNVFNVHLNVKAIESFASLVRTSHGGDLV